MKVVNGRGEGRDRWGGTWRTERRTGQRKVGKMAKKDKNTPLIQHHEQISRTLK